MLKHISQFFSSDARRFNVALGKLVSYLALILVLITVYDVTLRYVFSAGSVAIQELQWHVFSLMFLLGAAYTFDEDGHVRVDVIYSSRGERYRAWVDLLGSLFFLLPFSVLIIWASIPYVADSFALIESSADPGGLPFRFLIKAAIPACFVLLFFQGVFQVLSSLRVLLGRADSV